ncbi:MAG: TetR family transcriptional regulator [Gordonia sp. (in: high G+C Gram-positive bacteria)]
MLTRQTRRGRPRGESTARARILDAAGPMFTENGYSRTSLRAIAAKAGVDAALISYHFGGKHGLFTEVMSMTDSPSRILGRALEYPDAQLPEAILRETITTWDDDTRLAQLVATARRAADTPEFLDAFRGYIVSEVIGRLSARLGTADALRRATATSVIVVGLITERHLIKVGQLASMTPDEVVETLLPALRAAMAPQRARH